MFKIDTYGNGVTYLVQNGNEIMSNSQQELLEHQEFLNRPLSGDVLVTGLGLGFINKYLIDKPDIKSVTIVEKYSEVIDLTWNTCPKDDRFSLVHADADTWEPTQTFDWGWFDSWTDFHHMAHEKWREVIREKYTPYIGENIFFWIPEEDRHKREHLSIPVL